MDARYEYHPPRLLSEMEPTRADISAKTAWAGREGLEVGGERVVDLRGRKGEKCFVRRRGPRVLILKVSRASG